MLMKLIGVSLSDLCAFFVWSHPESRGVKMLNGSSTGRSLVDAGLFDEIELRMIVVWKVSIIVLTEIYCVIVI